MAEDEVVAVGQPAQQLARLLAHLPVELAGVGRELVGKRPDQPVHLRRVVDCMVHVGEDFSHRASQGDGALSLNAVDLDVHPRLNRRAVRHVGVVVDVVDVDQGAVLASAHDHLRVQHPFDGCAGAIELGAHRLDQERRVGRHDVDGRGVAVYVDGVDQRLVSSTYPAEGELGARQLGERTGGAAGHLAAGVGKVAACEGLRVDARVLDTRLGVGHQCSHLVVTSPCGHQ